MRIINRFLSRHGPVSQCFITTPIFYVNADPHIGHVHTLVLADALHRLNLLRGAEKTIFSTGTDEHGLKVQRAAQAKGLEPLEFCNNISSRFRKLCETFNISNTHFVRTTDDDHRKAVQCFWSKLREKDYIYQSKYSGWYSVPDETFLPSSQIEEKEIDGKKVKVSSETGHILEWFEEDNYMFRLSEFGDPLMKILESERLKIRPGIFHDLVKHLIKQGLQDISVSRPISRLSWGIPVPQDESHRIYVWLDALVNYLTVSGYPETMNAWPPSYHVIGKDIIKFHAIYWPAFLIAADLEVPEGIICHSHWTVDDLKMSKSLGNMVDPFDLLKIFAPESIRYYLLRQAVPDDDGNFSLPLMKTLLNQDLADTLGNLLSRCSGSTINKRQIYPETPRPSILEKLPVSDLIESLNSLSTKVENHFEEAHFLNGINEVLHSLRLANKLVHETKPWELAKKSEQEELLNAIIYAAFETLRVAGIVLQPVIPKTCNKLLDKLNVLHDQRSWSHALPCFNHGTSKERQLEPGSSILYTRVK